MAIRVVTVHWVTLVDTAPSRPLVPQGQTICYHLKVLKVFHYKRGFNARFSFVRLLFFNRRSLHEFCEKSPPYVSTFGWNWITFHFILYSEFWCHRTSTTNGFVQQYRMKKLNPMLFCGVPPTSKTEHFSLLPYPVICTTCHCAVIGCKVIWKRKKKVIGIHITIKTG